MGRGKRGGGEDKGRGRKVGGGGNAARGEIWEPHQSISYFNERFFATITRGGEEGVGRKQETVDLQLGMQAEVCPHEHGRSMLTIER